VLALTLLALVGGCKTVTLHDRFAGLAVKNAEVERHVPIYHSLSYGLEPDPWSMANGLAAKVTSLMENQFHQTQLELLQQAMDINGVKPADLLRTDFVRQLQPIIRTVETNGDAVFQLEILQIGFTEAGWFKEGLVPTIQVQAWLLRPDGKSLWKRQVTVGRRKDVPLGATAEGYRQNPEKLRSDWEAQIDFVVSQLLRDD
jgi:hypothetical protein